VPRLALGPGAPLWSSTGLLRAATPDTDTHFFVSECLDSLTQMVKAAIRACPFLIMPSANRRLSPAAPEAEDATVRSKLKSIRLDGCKLIGTLPLNLRERPKVHRPKAPGEIGEKQIDHHHFYLVRTLDEWVSFSR